jgi:thioredoxin-dependent peroxiredoxin
MQAYRDQYAQIFRNGRGVVLIAISVDAPEAQAAWARDAEMPFLFASDSGSVVGRRYGAFLQRPNGVVDNRTLYVVGPDGRISYRAAPFREVDPTSYTDLGAAIARLVPADSAHGN